MTKQKVLVFDDNADNLKIAQLQLGSICELTIVSTYDEAEAALLPVRNYKKTAELLLQYCAAAGLPEGFKPYSGTASDEQNKMYDLANAKAWKDATVYPEYDVVLTDLLVIPSETSCTRFPTNEEMPVGSIIALLALATGVQKVALVTNACHHTHKASAALDCFQTIKPKISLICTHSGGFRFDRKTGEKIELEDLHSDESYQKYPLFDENSDWANGRQGIVRGKNWKEILDKLNAFKQ